MVPLTPSMIDPDAGRVKIDGETYARCPCCGDWLELTPYQRDGLVCIDHSRPGCGYHGYPGGDTLIPGDPLWRVGLGDAYRMVGDE